MEPTIVDHIRGKPTSVEPTRLVVTGVNPTRVKPTRVGPTLLILTPILCKGGCSYDILMLGPLLRPKIID